MRIVVFEDKDARDLLDRLELDRWRKEKHAKLDAAAVIQVHRAMAGIVEAWLREHGADV